MSKSRPFNLLMPISLLTNLEDEAHELSKAKGKKVSMASIIRRVIKVYYVDKVK